MLHLEQTPYNLRSRSCLKRKLTSTSVPIQKKRLRNYDHTSSLPDEILLHIFSFLDIEDLYFNVRVVCKRWQQIAMLSSSWGNVTVKKEIPTPALRNWIQTSPVIRHLKVADRNDADMILKDVSKYSPNLETITIENCWGSTERIYLQSKALCRLINNCKKLEKIVFEKVKIRSCKFFKLLAKKRNNGKFMQLYYVGPVTVNQYRALRESSSGWIFTEYFEVDDSN